MTQAVLKRGNEAPAVKTGFERYEFKYWVPEELARETVKFAAPYLQIDAFSEPGVGQCNTSLYFDTPDLLFGHMHAASSPDRFKLRVRRYGDPPTSPAFFEIKRKIKNVIVKQRAILSWEVGRELLLGNFTELPQLKTAQERRNLETFLTLRLRHGAEPKVFIRAHREAYAANDPLEDVRLTLDREVLYQPACGLDFRVWPEKWIPIDRFIEHGEHGRRVMLELKFRGLAPLWMSELVDRLGLWRLGYSKYMSSISREIRDFGGVPGWDARR